jgi:hypothetical protein
MLSAAKPAHTEVEMKSYQVEASNDDLIVVITGDEKSKTIVIPVSDRDALATAIEELLKEAYLDGKTEGRGARRRM